MEGQFEIFGYFKFDILRYVRFDVPAKLGSNETALLISLDKEISKLKIACGLYFFLNKDGTNTRLFPILKICNGYNVITHASQKQKKV